MCTTICTAPMSKIVTAVVDDLSKTFAITSQNGIAVRKTDSTKPVR